MASADVRQELDCSVCLNIYTDPVTLRCGHNFCRVCIDGVLDTQEGSGVYSCPECRAESQERPALIRNITLCNIVRGFLTTHKDPEENGILCTYCVDSRVSAVMSCLLCEASLCDKHLRVHSKSAEHVLCDPSTSLGNRKCSTHKKILEYYCTEDAACICVYCSAGEHRGHHVEVLDEAFEKRKTKLRHFLQDLTSKRNETKKRVQRLQKRRREDQEKAADIEKSITALFRDIRRQLEDLEKGVLGEIYRQKELVSLSVSDLIQKLEIKENNLSAKICHIEDLCNMSDPVTFLQDPDTGDCGHTEDRKTEGKQDYGGRDLDLGLVSETLCILFDRITSITRGIYMPEISDLLLDVNTASNNLCISDDRKTASWSHENLNFLQLSPVKYKQVLSTGKFSSGRYYWEVEVSNSERWMVGMCYPSIKRKGGDSDIGNNNKSWCLFRGYLYQLFVLHNRQEIHLPNKFPIHRVRIYLDYEAGQLSFYALDPTQHKSSADQPVRHLYTFTATFTGPLHAALCLCDGEIKISGEVRSWKKLP